MKRTPLRRGTKQLKKTKLKKQSTSDVARLKRKVWKQLSIAIRKRDPKCVTCGGNNHAAGHYRHNTDKGNGQLGGNALWYDERNIHSQCTGCNNFKSGALDKYSLYLEATYGKGILQELNTLFNTPKKWTMEELEQIYEYYRQKEIEWSVV